MKKVISILAVVGSLYSSEYFAKANPVDEFHIRSSVAGQVVSVSLKSEGKVSDGGVILKIDDKIDLAELASSKSKLEITKESIKLLQESVKNSKRSMQIAKGSYDRVKNLQSYSRVQKDAKLTALINSTNSYIQSKTNLQKQKTILSDLEVKIKSLKDKIDKKNIKIKKGDLIYKIYPNVGDFVGIGAKLVDSYDISHAKLVIYLNEDDLRGIKDKKIYIDSKETEYKIDKIWSVADSKNISSYRAEIIIDAPKLFSKLVKVEFK
jgi:multidrug resistance efflux pump